MKYTWITVGMRVFGHLWPLTLAVLVCVLPTTYGYLTFQYQWQDAGALLHIINNLFERGYFHSYDWGFDHLKLHFTPFFYVLAPLVHLTRSLFFFSLLHALACAISAWLYYKFAKAILGSSLLGALCYFTLLTNPYFMAANLSFHFEVFMALALMAFAFFAVGGQWWLALPCLVIALIVKEDVWIYGIAASVILLGYIPTRQAALYLGTSVAYYVLILCVLYPMLYPDAVDFFHYSWMYGNSKGEVLYYLVTYPWETGKRLITGSGLNFNLMYLFLPVLAGWRFLPCLAVLYLWVNSTAEFRSSLTYYYSLPCIVLYGLTIPFALMNLERLWARLQVHFPTVIPGRKVTLIVLFAIVVVGSLSHWRPPPTLVPTLPSVFAHRLQIARFLRIHRALNHFLADSHKSVLASFTIGAYVPPRGNFFMIQDAGNVMHGSLRPDFVVFDVSKREPYIDEETVRSFLAYMQASPEYRIVADIEQLIIFAKE